MPDLPEHHPLHLRAEPGAATLPPCLSFGRFELRFDTRQLLVDRQPAPLRGRALAVLFTLARSPGTLVSRQQLLDEVWEGQCVEDGNISVQINALRKLLGGDLITTTPGFGYRLRLPGPPSAPPPLAPPAAAPAPDQGTRSLTRLPPTPALLLGRDDDLAALAALVQDGGLVTVLGPTGVGKTRLVQRLLHDWYERFEHGVCFVELAALVTPEAVAPAVAAAAGLPLTGAGDPVVQLVQALAPLRMLVSLDNAEHLVGGVAAVCGALQAGAPGIQLLVTSQASLRVAGERQFRLKALAVPPPGTPAQQALQFGAVALLVQRAQAADRRFAVDDGNVAAVIELCQRLDGMPLAIELAASRLPWMGLTALLASLDQRLRLLTGGRRDAPLRHQALGAALGWTHALLTPTEQRVFRRLAVFAGSAALALVRQVLVDADGALPDVLDEWQALDALDVLVDRSLLAVSGDFDTPRMHLLESPLALARQQLQDAGEAEALQRRHAQVVYRLLNTAIDAMLAGTQGVNATIDQLAPEIDNAQLALRWALANDPALALRMAPLLSLALGRHRYAEAVVLWQAVEPLLDGGMALPAPQRAWALLQCAEHWQSTRTQHACARAEQARDLALSVGDRRTAFRAQWVMAYAAYRRSDAATLERVVAAARALLDPAWPPVVRAAQAPIEALQCLQAQDHDGAIHWRMLQAALLRAAGASDSIARVNIAAAQMNAGRYEEAIVTARALAEQLQAVRDQRHRCFALTNLSGALLALDRAAEAREVLQQAWPLACRYDLLPQWADDATLIAALEHRPHAALRLSGYANAAFAALGQPREPVDQPRFDRAVRLALAALPGGAEAAHAARLQAEGAALKDGDLPALAFATQDRD